MIPKRFADTGLICLYRSGFILSGTTVQAFAQAQEIIMRTFDPQRISQWWFGDFMVADALDEGLGVQVTGMDANSHV